MAEVFTNLAKSTLASGITAGASSLTVATGDGNLLFPVLSGSDFFRCLLFKKATGDMEIIKVTARAADVFTILRGQENIGNATATAFAFDAGDIIELRPTRGFFESLGGVTSAAIQSTSYNFGADGGSANAYSVTLSPTPASYASPLPIMFVANATNTGNSTLEEAGLGFPKSIRRLDGALLRAGDIVVNEVAYVIYDATSTRFILLNPRSAGEASDYTFDKDVSIGGVASFDAVHDYGTVTATATLIDWNNGNKQEITLSPSSGNNISLTFTNPPGPTGLVLNLTQDGSGSRTVTWPAAVKWPSDIIPSLSTGANKKDIVSLYFDGSQYFNGILSNYS